MSLKLPANTTLLGRVVRLPLRLIPRTAIFPIVQGAFRGMRWIVGSSDHGCWLGTYEAYKRRRFEALVEPGMVVYDIGAHVGYYTLLSSTLVGNTGTVVAFEPLPENVAYLRRHIELNHLTNVQVVEAAVADRQGKMTFSVAPSRSMGHLGEGGGLEVDACSLDFCIENTQYPIPQVLKIDVEGAEAQVLIGAQSLLRLYRPIIFLATHGESAHQDSLTLLKNSNYSFEPLDAPSIDKAKEILAIPIE